MRTEAGIMLLAWLNHNRSSVVNHLTVEIHCTAFSCLVSAQHYSYYTRFRELIVQQNCVMSLWTDTKLTDPSNCSAVLASWQWWQKMPQMMLSPHVFQNQVFSWQWLRQITESVSAFSSEGKGLNCHDPLLDGLLVLVSGLGKGFFSALFVTLESNPPEDSLKTCWDKLTSSAIAQGKAGLIETSLSFPVLSFGSCLAANSSPHLPSACSPAPSTHAVLLHLLLTFPTSSLSFYFPMSNFIALFPFQPPSQVQTPFNSTNIA